MESERAKAVMADIYRPLFLRDFPDRLYRGLESAEMIKYAANAFLATKITFINESRRCAKRSVPTSRRCRAAWPWTGDRQQVPACRTGYGGSCFPKDTRALARIGQDFAAPLQIVESVIKVNDEIKRRMVDKIVDLCGGEVRDKTIAVLGVTFKPNTDDMRDAPSLTIVPSLVGGGARVRVVDPEGRARASGCCRASAGWQCL